MNYFDQITAGAEPNLLLLLGDSSVAMDDTTRRAIFKRNVEIVNLELSYLCNRKCDYCPVKDSTRADKQIMMSKDLLRKICAELKEIRYENRISLNLYNEPLMDSTLEEKIFLIKEHLPYCHVAFNSNGDKLTYKRLQSLSDAGCDFIRVTLHPPPGKIQSVATIKRRVLKFYERLAKHTCEDFDFTSNDHIEFRSLGVKIRLQWPDWRAEGSSRAGILIHHVSKRFIRTQPCTKPFREFTVFYDGAIQPCCEAFHDDTINLAPMGNLANDSIFDVYSSKLLSRFRRHVFDFGPKQGICESCNITDYSLPAEDSFRKEILSKVNS